MDDFLSLAANPVIYETFPWLCMLHIKAQNDKLTHSGEATCKALLPTINCDTADCDKQNQAQMLPQVIRLIKFVQTLCLLIKHALQAIRSGLVTGQRQEMPR
jgi:hypothetical protein